MIVEMSRIRVMPDAVASRIAAGEVVERPASAVKELVENAVDAGATRVEVLLSDGGKRSIAVRDDGAGMDRDDALLAFEPHATSKLSPDFDLSRLEFRGFRGEALAAIAACARVTLTTAQQAGEGTQVRFAFGRLANVASVGAPRGTSVEITELFGELPARRKFLRSAQAELAHVVRFLEQQALATPALHVILRHDDRMVLDLSPAASDASRVRQVLGAGFADEALALSGERDGVAVRAWLVRSRSGLGRILGVTLLLNGRPIQDRGLAHAVREASERLFGIGEGAAGLVMVELSPLDVDVNVHPAKREVRFARPAQVHDALRDALRGEVVAGAAFRPALDIAEGSARLGVASGPFVAERAATLPGMAPSDARPAGWGPSPSSPLPAGRRVLGQHRNTYILVEDDQGLVLVDQHAAHERVLYERVIASMESSAVGQSLLEPVVVEVSRAAAARLVEHLPDLQRLGFDVEEFGSGAFTIRSVPASVGTADPAELLRELAASEDGPSTLERVHRVAATIACKAAVKAGFSLGHERMRFIVDALMACETPTTCPHGRVALLRLSDRDIDHRFGRI